MVKCRQLLRLGVDKERLRKICVRPLVRSTPCLMVVGVNRCPIEGIGQVRAGILLAWRRTFFRHFAYQRALLGRLWKPGFGRGREERGTLH